MKTATTNSSKKGVSLFVVSAFICDHLRESASMLFVDRSRDPNSGFFPFLGIKGRDVLIHSLAGVTLPLRARQEFTADARNDASKDQGWKRKGVGCVGGLSVSCRAAHERR